MEGLIVMESKMSVPAEMERREEEREEEEREKQMEENVRETSDDEMKKIKEESIELNFFST